MQIYYEFFISATISSPNMTRDSNELNLPIYAEINTHNLDIILHST